ncbi:hypothetical protein CPL00363_CDS0140 [Klebsiella phage Torridgeon]
MGMCEDFVEYVKWRGTLCNSRKRLSEKVSWKITALPLGVWKEPPCIER